MAMLVPDMSAVGFISSLNYSDALSWQMFFFFFFFVVVESEVGLLS